MRKLVVQALRNFQGAPRGEGDCEVVAKVITPSDVLFPFTTLLTGAAIGIALCCGEALHAKFKKRPVQPKERTKASL